MQSIIHAGRSRIVVLAAAVVAMAVGAASAQTGRPGAAYTLRQDARNRGITDFKVVWSESPAGMPKALISNNNANWDGQDALSSEHNTMVTDSRSADDIIPPVGANYLLTSATGVLITTPGMPVNANFEVYCDNGGKPAECDPVCTGNTSGYTFLGAAFGFYDIRRYNFNLSGCILTGGTRYWVSVVQNGGSGQGWFATACNGICFGYQGHFKSCDTSPFALTLAPGGGPMNCSPTCFPTWTPDNAIFGTPKDFAFTVTGTATAAPSVGCPGSNCDPCATDPLPMIEAKLDELKPEVVDLKSEVVDIKGDTTNIKNQVNQLVIDVASVETKLDAAFPPCMAQSCLVFATGADITFGTPAGGTYLDLSAQDSVYFSVKSVTSGSMRLSQYVAHFTVPPRCPGDPVSLNFCARVLNLNVSYKLEYLDHTTGSFTSPPGWSGSLTGGTLHCTPTLLLPATAINALGQVEIRVTASRSGGGAQFTLDSDLLRLNSFCR